MRILIVSQYYWPEDFAAGVYVPELAEGLHALGHEVQVVTGFPNYPAGRIAPGYRGRLFERERRHGVDIVRGWFYPSPRSSGAARRGASALTFGMTGVLSALGAGRADVVLGFSPPIFMAGAAWAIARARRIPFVLNVKDLFTDAVVSSGLVRAGALTTALARAERTLYARADHVVTPAHSFARELTLRGVPETRLTVIPDWADGEFITPRSRETALRAEWGLAPDDFVLLYSGSLGYSSELETVLHAAALLRDEPRFRLVVVGDGVKRPALEALAREQALTNTQFHPLQPRARIPEVFATADLSLVTLSATGGRVSTQGKLYSLMAAGRPVLAVVPPTTDSWTQVGGDGVGWTVAPGDAAGVAARVRALMAAPAALTVAGRRAREVFDSTYSLDACVRRFSDTLSAVVSRENASRMAPP